MYLCIFLIHTVIVKNVVQRLNNTDKNMKNRSNYPILFSVFTLIILVMSFVFTFDRKTWVLEVFPILLGFPILFFTYKRFPFTNLIYILLTIHFVILSIGGIYTYA